MQWTPCIVWTLAISLGYAICMHWAVGELAEGGLSAQLYYLQGLLLGIPFAILAKVARNAKHLWQFLLVGVVLLFAGFYISNSYFFAVIIGVLWFVRFINRLKDASSSLDGTNGFLLLTFVVCFIAAGSGYEVFLQKMSIYHFIIVGLLTFNYYGIQRYEFYVKLRKDKANMPINRIMDTGTRNFVVTALIVILCIVPVIEYGYAFVPFVWEQGDSEYEYDTDSSEEEQEEQQTSLSLEDLVGIKEPSIWLQYLWAVLEKITVIALYIAAVWFIVHGIYKMVRNFNKIQIEKNDVIESTFVVADEENRTRRKKRFEEMFDFSYTMKVRRRYKKELKKYNPKHWQTPSEMEAMADLEMPELHQLYEEVRYGEEKGR